MKPELDYRQPASESDINFIYSSWLRSYRKQQQLVPEKIYFDGERKLIASLLPKCQAILAVPANEVEPIISWCVWRTYHEVIVIEYIYTKHTFRGMGIASQLLNHINKLLGREPMISTRMTKAAYRLAEKNLIIYNPYKQI